MQSGVALADRLVGGLAAIVELADRTSLAVQSISVATQQQQVRDHQLAQTMASILR
jgi:hypothetical protein